MPRVVDLHRRTALLDRVVGYLGQHGIADVSFRTMARALGVSVNTLVHHFGTKEQLLVAALQRGDQVQHEVEQGWRQRRPNITQVQLLRAWWKWSIASPDNLAITRLLLEGSMLHRTSLHRTSTVGWRSFDAWYRSVERGLIAEGAPPDVAATEANLATAVLTGLIIEHISTGHKAPLTRALDAHLARMEQVMRESRVDPIEVGTPRIHQPKRDDPPIVQGV